MKTPSAGLGAAGEHAGQDRGTGSPAGQIPAPPTWKQPQGIDSPARQGRHSAQKNHRSVWAAAGSCPLGPVAACAGLWDEASKDWPSVPSAGREAALCWGSCLQAHPDPRSCNEWGVGLWVEAVGRTAPPDSRPFRGSQHHHRALSLGFSWSFFQN